MVREGRSEERRKIGLSAVMFSAALGVWVV